MLFFLDCSELLKAPFSLDFSDLVHFCLFLPLWILLFSSFWGVLFFSSPLKCQCFTGFCPRKCLLLYTHFSFPLLWFQLPAICWWHLNLLYQPRPLLWALSVSRCSRDISNSLCPQLNSILLLNLFFLVFPWVNGNTPVTSKPEYHSWFLPHHTHSFS